MDDKIITPENYDFAKKITEFAEKCVNTLDKKQMLRMILKINEKIDKAYERSLSE